MKGFVSYLVLAFAVVALQVMLFQVKRQRDDLLTLVSQSMALTDKAQSTIEVLQNQPRFSDGVRYGFLAVSTLGGHNEHALGITSFPQLETRASNLWYAIAIERGTNRDHLQSAFLGEALK